MTASWLLALETSVTRATLVLACEGREIATRSFDSERSQECDLFPPLRDLLTALPTGEKLATVIVGTGPGSYNGARVGIAAAQAIAQHHNCPVAPLCSFEGVTAALENDTAWALGDARRGSYFILAIEEGRARNPPQILNETAFLAALPALVGPRLTFESPDRLPALTGAVQTRSTASGLLRAWLNRTDPEKEALQRTPAEAFYLRPPHITKSTRNPVLPPPAKP